MVRFAELISQFNEPSPGYLTTRSALCNFLISHHKFFRFTLTPRHHATENRLGHRKIIVLDHKMPTRASSSITGVHVNRKKKLEVEKNIAQITAANYRLKKRHRCR